MDKKKILAYLALSGVSARDIAANLGVSRSAVYGVISHNVQSKRIMSYIADTIDKPVGLLFPERKG